MRTDFELWLEWYRRFHSDSTATDEECKAAYDTHYFCNCNSCEYRKERGFIPVYNGSSGCKLDPRRGDLNHVPTVQHRIA